MVADNETRDIQLDNGTLVNLSLWDTSVAEEYSRLRPLSYYNTDVFIISFAINDTKHVNDKYQYHGMDFVEKICFPEVRHHCPKVPIILVGTKLDLRTTDTMYSHSYETGLQLAEKIGAVTYFECSALSRKGVASLFKLAAEIGFHYQEKPKAQKTQKKS